MIRTIMAAALALAVTLPAAPAHAAARARVFVASYGSDSNPCTFGSPCKTFQNAVNVVAAGGEVTAIDSAGFGPIIINKSVTITSPDGVEAGIAAPAGQLAITVSVQSTDTVSLHGLTLDGNGNSPAGVAFTSGGGRLEIVDCLIRNFIDQGISVVPTTALAVVISNTTVTDIAGTSGAESILFFQEASNAPITAALDQVKVSNGSIGIAAITQVANAPIQLLISNSHIDNNNEYGIDTSSVSSSSPIGVIVNNVTLNQTPTGVLVGNAASIWLSHVTQTTTAGFTSTAGVDVASSPTVFSDGTNHFMGGVIHGILGTWAAQ
jgi:hypothetical protein